MKTKAAFKSLLGLALLTSVLAGSVAEAQIKKRSQLKTKVSKAAALAKAEKKSRFGFNISETYYGKLQNEDNFIGTWLTGSFAITDNVSLSLETGFNAYMEKQESNMAYDTEAGLTVSGMEITKDLTFTAGLIGVMATSRSSREKNMVGAFGARANFGLKIGGVSLGLDNSFYQLAYRGSPIATPEADLFDSADEKRFYGSDYTRANSGFSVGIPIGPVKFKNDVRFRQSTPYEGDVTRSLRYRTRVSYGITKDLSVSAGVWWFQKISDPKRAPFFDAKNRTLFLNLSLDV